MRESFQGFCSWLRMNEGKTPERAGVLASNLRSLESRLPNTGYIDSKIDLTEERILINIYAEFEDHSQYNKSEALKAAKKATHIFKTIFNIIDTEIEAAKGDKKHATRASLRTKEEVAQHDVIKQSILSEFKTALTQYCYYLSEMFPFFNTKELITAGCIKRKPKVTKPRFSAEYYRLGIVQLMEKHMPFLFKSGKIFDKTCEGLLSLMEEAICLHGGKLSNVLHTTGFMTSLDKLSIPNWKVNFANNVNINIKGMPFTVPPGHTLEFKNGKLLLYRESRIIETIDLPQMSSSPKEKTKLQVLPTCTLSIVDHCNLLDSLRTMSVTMETQINDARNKIQEISECDNPDAANCQGLINALNEIISKIRIQYEEILYSVGLYGRSFILELIAV